MPRLILFLLRLAYHWLLAFPYLLGRAIDNRTRKRK